MASSRVWSNADGKKSHPKFYETCLMKFVVFTVEHRAAVPWWKTARLCEEWIFPSVGVSFDKTWLCCSFALIKVKILSSSLQQPPRAAKWIWICSSPALRLSAGEHDYERKNGISVGCVLWMWLHIPVVLLKSCVLFFASLLLWFWHVCISSACLWHVGHVEHANANKTRGEGSIAGRVWGVTSVCSSTPGYKQWV